jgi:uncharacterized protein (DUF302 family)
MTAAISMRSLRVSRLPAILVTFALLLAGKAAAADGLITLQSHYGPTETLRRLEAAVKARGFTVFAHIDHAAGAAEVGLMLRPTDLLIFGNPKGGTPLMQSLQTVGIDLPLKALVWQDERGTTWLSYNDPVWLVHRHGDAAGLDAAVRNISNGLTAVAAAATSGSTE